VKSYGAFIDIGEDVGLLHTSEISHVRVTSMEALFFPKEKIKVSFWQIKRASHCYNDYFYTWN
jgi:ribosomal protein S1